MAATKEELQTLNQLLEKVNKTIISIGKNSEKAFEEIGDSKSLEDIKKTEKAIDELNASTKELEKNKKDQIKLNTKLNSLRKGEQDQRIKTNLAIQNETKALKDNIKRRNESQGSLNRLRLQLNEARKRFDGLSKSERENSAVGGRLTKVIKGLDTEVRRLEKDTGRAQRNVGNYGDALGNISPTLGQLATGAGAVILGVQALGGALRSGFDIIKNFNQAQADLSAISGKSKEELIGLTNQAKLLGGTTQFTATEITNLQIELAKLGFSTNQISDSTEGIANFAAATGAEIPEAAALAGSALRAFGLEANEIDRVVSTLGVATTKSALDFGKLQTGLSTVAPVAASFGFSIEDTTALLGQLSNAGFDASSAATATRNILLNLADANGSLAKELGRPIKSADDLAVGLQELQAKGIDLGEALELTDKRSVAAFNTFIEGSDSLIELRDSITDVNDELQLMAEKRLDSIDGQLTLLSSAWEGFVLSLEDGEGVLADVSKIILNDISLALQQMTDATSEAGDKFSLLGSVLAIIKTNITLLLTPFRIFFNILFEIGQTIFNLINSFTNFIGLTDDLSVSLQNFVRVLTRLPLIVSTIGSQIVKSLKPLSDAFEGIFTLDFDKFVNALKDSKKALGDIPSELRKLFESNEEANEVIDESTEIVDKNTDAIKKNTDAKKEQKDGQIEADIAEFNRLKALDEAYQKSVDDYIKGLDDKLEAQIKFEQDFNSVIVDEAIETNDDLRKVLDDRKKQEEKRLKEQKELTDAATNIIEAGLKKRRDARLKTLDEELEGSKEQRNKLEDLAQKGSEFAIKSIALAQKREAELRREKAKEVEKEKRDEIILAGIKSFGDNQSATKTLSEIGLLLAGLETIGSAFDGVDDTGGRGNIDSKGGKLWTLHPNEQVWSKEDRKSVGFKTRDEIKNIVNLHERGVVSNKDVLPSFEINQERFATDKVLLEKFDNIEYAIKNMHKKMPVSSGDYNAFRDAIVQTIKKGNKIHKTNYLFD